MKAQTVETVDTQVAVIKQEVAPVVARAGAIVVSNPQQYEGASDFLKTIKAAEKRVEEQVLKPLRESKAKIEETRRMFEAMLLTPLENAEAAIKTKMVTFQKEQERIRAAEEARLRAIEEERARKEREKAEAAARLQREKEAQAQREAEEARRKAAAAKNAEERERLQKEADKRQAEATAAAAKAQAKEEAAASVQVADIHVESSTPEIAGQSMRTTWKARITDPKAAAEALMKFPDWAAYVQINQGQVDKFAARTKGSVAVAGIEWYEASTLASTSR